MRGTQASQAGVTLDQNILTHAKLWLLARRMHHNAEVSLFDVSLCSPQVHPHWWEASAAVLGNLGGTAGHLGGTTGVTNTGFGVTPAVMHTGGALLLVDTLRRRHGRDFVGGLIEAWGPELW